MAGCHVVPLSVETSTPPTLPPPVSVAVPRDGERLPDRNGSAGGRRGDRRRRGRGVGARARGRQPGLQRGGLHAHVGEQVDRRLLHGGVRGRRRAAGRGCCPGPTPTGRCRRRRPARRSEPGTASGGGSRCPARRCCRSPGAVDAVRGRRGQADQARPAGSRCRASSSHS